jgi:glycosyltransferase involved in cell wall biosynthesis
MRVLFIYMNDRSFQNIDRKLLEERHQVLAIDFRWTNACVAQVIEGVKWCDLVFGWFASHHTALPAILAHRLKKKIIIAASDYDLAGEDFLQPSRLEKARETLRGVVGQMALRAAHWVIVPSQWSQDLALRNPALACQREKVCVVPHGFEDPQLPTAHKETVCTTVGDLHKWNWIRKGHRDFVTLASRFRDVSFYLVGKPRPAKFLDVIQSNSSPNLRIPGYLSDPELGALLARTGIYLQLSCREAFCCALAEAMLLRCTPVVARAAALPEVVGDCGFYCEYGNVDDQERALHTALDGPDLGESAHQRILECFSLERRRRAIAELLSAL